jgi:group II intron reverse transcriptase/maturase
MAKGGRLSGMPGKAQVREMRNAETILGIVRDRGSRGLPLEDVYRQLFNPDLYLAAYGKISKNDGALTPGVVGETADGMDLQKVQGIIELLRAEKFRWTPVRRTYIEKKGSTKKRPLGIPTWTDKLLQEVIRLILEAYYEPQFSPRSHGFRPRRGCHSALDEVYKTWRGTAWFIEGDIKGCFDNLDHEVLLAILRERIHDNRFLRLIEGLLKAGYMEDWKYHRTQSGTPQGGVVSPVLANIYLDRLDQYVENVLTPAYTRGDERKPNPVYHRMSATASYRRRTGRAEEATHLRKQMRQLPTIDPNDPQYRRLRYVRYADDFLLGFAGPKDEAEAIKRQLGEFLRDRLKLELAEPKTLVTHGRSAAARFLGYEITVGQRDTALFRKAKGHKTRQLNGAITLKIPLDVVRSKCEPYLKNGKPVHRAERLNDDAVSIVRKYEDEYRGIVEYYRKAVNLRELGRLKWVMETSLTKTLAHKFKVSVAAIYRKYQTQIETETGVRKVLRVTAPRDGKPPLVATWGRTRLNRKPGAILNDQPGQVWNNAGTEIVERLKADTCELCGSRENVQSHHIRKLADLNRPGRPDKPEWVKTMASRQRKKLAVCFECHVKIHNGRLTRWTKTPTGYRRAG